MAVSFPENEGSKNGLSTKAWHILCHHLHPRMSFCHLSIINKVQESPPHWCLFVAAKGQPGKVYEDSEDAEYMIYQPSTEPIDITKFTIFLTLYQLAVMKEQQEMLVKQVADIGPPPQALNREPITDNCQGWVVRVITKLVERDIVPSSKLEMARSMMQPVWTKRSNSDLYLPDCTLPTFLEYEAFPKSWRGAKPTQNARTFWYYDRLNLNTYRMKCNLTVKSTPPVLWVHL